MTVATQLPARPSSSVPWPPANTDVAARAWSRKPAAAPRLACGQGRGVGTGPGLQLCSLRSLGVQRSLVPRLPPDVTPLPGPPAGSLLGVQGRKATCWGDLTSPETHLGSAHRCVQRHQRQRQVRQGCAPLAIGLGGHGTSGSRGVLASGKKGQGRTLAAAAAAAARVFHVGREEILQADPPEARWRRRLWEKAIRSNQSGRGAGPLAPPRCSRFSPTRGPAGGLLPEDQREERRLERRGSEVWAQAPRLCVWGGGTGIGTDRSRRKRGR